MFFEAAHLMLKITVLIIFCFIQATFGASVSNAATTACSIGGGINYELSIANNIFPRDAPIGTESPPYSTTVQITCIPDTSNYKISLYIYAPAGVTLPGSTSTNTFQTNLPNIAVRYILENGPGTSCTPYSQGWPSQVNKEKRTINCTVTGSAQGTPQTFNLKLSAFFSKIGNDITGNLTTVPPVVLQQYDPNASPLVNVFSGVATGTFSISACSVTTPDIAVPMPKTYTYRLPNVGSTDGETSLNIALNCDAGVKVYTTLADVSSPANKTTTLSLSPDSTAQGIGYQILFNGSLITLGIDSAIPGNPGQFLITPAQTTGGPVTVPLTARYIRTGKIGSGSANGKATFTMSYQ
jgi:type 1 fimbria pilin